MDLKNDDEKESNINIELTKENYKIIEVKEILNIGRNTVINYCKYFNIQILNYKHCNFISKSDLKILIDWCNAYKKSERSNMIIEKSMMKKYGVKHALQSKEIQNKAQETCKEHFGVNYPTQSKEIRENMKKSNIILYGDENPSKLDFVKNKRENTIMKLYGVKNIFQNRDVINQIKETKLKKNGRIGQITTAVYNYKTIDFDSEEELCYYVYNHEILKNNICRGKFFEYFVNGISHIYECDFLLNDENIEIKGHHFLNENMELIDYFGDKHVYKEKTQCMRDNNVKIILDNSEEMLKIISEVKHKFPNLIESCRKKKNEKSENRLCYDPRINHVENRIVKYRVLYGWAFDNLDLLNGLTPMEFATSCLFIYNDNYIYDENEAIKLLKSNCLNFQKIKIKSKYPFIICTNTLEIKSSYEWNKLGYNKALFICKKDNYVTQKGLHFEFAKDEDGNYIYDEETASKIINSNNIDTINS